MLYKTMVEMYTLQRFLDPEGLRQRGIEHFDARAGTFGEVIDTMENSPDGASLRPRSRFARFTNLPEHQQMFRAFTDVQMAKMLDLPRPRLESGKDIVVADPMSEERHDLQQKLVERYERLRSQKVDPRQIVDSWMGEWNTSRLLVNTLEWRYRDTCRTSDCWLTSTAAASRPGSTTSGCWRGVASPVA